MIRISVNNAILHDALQKAVRVAPTKGAAFDRAAGLYLTVDKFTDELIVRATNLDTTFLQRVPLEKWEGDASGAWRVSGLVANLVNTLPMNEESTTELMVTDAAPDALYVRNDRNTTKFPLSVGSFPMFEEFSPEGMTPAANLAGKIEQVSWACEDKGTSPMIGIHFDGSRLIGCSHASLAIVPCEIVVDRPVTAVVTGVEGLLARATDAHIRASGNRLQVLLDNKTQLTVLVIEGDFPKIDGIRRSDYLGDVVFNRTAFLDTLSRFTTISQKDRMPTVNVTFECDQIIKHMKLTMIVPGAGQMMDSFDMETDMVGTHTLTFDPARLREAVSVCNEHVTMSFGHENPSRSAMLPVRLRDSAETEILVMPLMPRAM